eukprot:14388035-Alexandrium_andersonii.AAC.1
MACACRLCVYECNGACFCQPVSIAVWSLAVCGASTNDPARVYTVTTQPTCAIHCQCHASLRAAPGQLL